MHAGADHQAHALLPQVDRLAVFYKQRVLGLHPAWAYTLPTTFLRIFYSATEAGIWSIIVYWTVGFAPDAGRSGYSALHQACCPISQGR